jgi:signal transduction histidine kinase
MARKTTSPLSKEDQYLQRIGDRSRESIDKMSDIIWSINPSHDTLEQMLVRMKNYTTEIAEAKDILLHWDEAIDHIQTKLSMEHRKNIYLFYKEVVNNVIKHSNAKNIYILIQSVKKGLTLCVNDDGKGFDITSVNAGNGLKNIKRRSTFLKGTIDIKSDSHKGTSITLFIPY